MTRGLATRSVGKGACSKISLMMKFLTCDMYQVPWVISIFSCMVKSMKHIQSIMPIMAWNQELILCCNDHPCCNTAISPKPAYVISLSYAKRDINHAEGFKAKSYWERSPYQPEQVRKGHWSLLMKVRPAHNMPLWVIWQHMNVHCYTKNNNNLRLDELRDKIHCLQ